MKKNLLTAIMVLLTTASALHAQVTQIAINKGLSFEAPLTNNKGILSSEIDKTLWVTDGTSEGTFQLSPTIKFVREGAVHNSKLIFVGNTAETGDELYITDGTIVGTLLLKDINTGAAGSSPDDDFAILNGIVYFTAAREAEGRELWKTDGSPRGTILLKDIVPGTVGSNDPNDYNLFSNGTYLLFSANTPTSGEELWISNGTDIGTVPLKDINPGAPSSNSGGFFKFGNIVLFSSTDGLHGTEVWKTDGTLAGTQLVKDIRAGTDSSVNATIFSFFLVYEFNGRAYFSANNGINGEEIWSTDGTDANTRMLKDIQPGAGSSINFFLGGFKVGNKFLFTATTTANGTELWETDGTDDGTKLFKDIVPGAVGSTPFILPSNQYDIATNTVTNAFFNGNKFFLIANTPANGFELWISDGTSAGTTMVKDINPGTENGAAISSYIYTSSGIYFTADDGVHGEEPWKSDGTDAGTTMVLNLNPVLDDNVDQDSDVSFAFYIINSKVIFSATDGVGTADDLYRLEGTFNPLPVKLGDFTVTPKNADAMLEWSTLSEINTKDFTVQRSEDGVKFTPIGTVVAAGSSSNERTYHFTDPGIINSGKAIVYYKLALNDRDGKSESTKVIALKLAGLRELSLKLLGNPVQSAIVVMVSGNTNNVTLSVKDMSGKTISTRAIKANGQISIPASNLAPGAYVIVAESDNSRTLLKFIKN